MDDSSPGLDHLEGTLEGMTLMFDKIGNYQWNWARNSGKAMDHDVSPLETIMDEIGCLMEVSANVTRFVIVDGDVEEIGNVGLRMSKIDTFGCWEYGFDL